MLQPIAYDAFLLLPSKDQLEHLLIRGVSLPQRNDPNTVAYELDDFYVRITIELDPLRVLAIEASRTRFR